MSRTLQRAFISLLLVVTTFFAITPPAQAAPYSVLVFSKTAGFRHDSIPAGIAAIQQLGAANNFTVTATEDAAAFNDANLATFSTVVFLSTTGDVLDANQQAAFERYIRAGHGFVGVHAAADTEYGWAWYGNLVGAYFASHPAVQNATVKVEDPAHPSTASLPQRWQRSEELYNFQTNPRGRVHVLASLDERSYTGGTMGADHPTAWCQDYDGGKSWYTGGGHDIAAFSDTNFRNHLLGGIQTTAGVVGSDCKASLTGSFQKVAIDTNTSNPMELDVAPDGRVFYIERDGRVQIIKPTTGTTVTALTLSVFTGNEDGLLGIRLDPSFATNGWVYLYYSPPTGGPRNQISRFTVTGDTIALSSERVLLQVTTQRDTCCHAGGSMTFDSAGNLYLATGDNTNPFESDGFAPLDERAGRANFDSQRTAGNTNDLRGKVIRIKPAADGTYTVPSGNLFPAGAALTRPEIFAMGFRNPFRIGVDKATNTLYVADYGPDAGAANPNRGPEGTVEWNVVTPGNYGWPYCHGANYAFNDFTFPSGPNGAPFNCAAIVNNSPNNTGLTNLPPAVPATVDYDYSGNPLFPEIGGGGAPMAGPVYRFNAALASDRKWPAYWDGKALFGEWNQNKLYSFQVTPDGRSLIDINQLLVGVNVLRPMDMEFGPDGAMYLIEWGTGFGGNNADSGIYRIDYIAGDAAPVAVASGTPTSGPTPLTVQFSSAGSNDPDGQPITYSWAFGDGGTSTAPNPSHVYTAAGNFTAQLTVRDPGGRTGIANVPITAGNTAPTVNLTFPADGGFFSWGDQIRYTVTVSDPETPSPNCANVTLQYYLGHDEHGHPVQNYPGCSGIVATATNSGHGDEANVFSVFEAVYTDPGGLVGRSTKVLQPKRKQAEHFSSTGRAPGAIGGGDPGVVRETTGDVAGGFQNIGFIEDGDYWAYTPMNLTNISSIGIRAASGAAGGRVEVRTGSASGTLLGTATIAATGAWQTYTDVTIPISVSTVSGPLFFVAKNPTGNTGQGPILNINWVDFIGRGMADSSALSVNPTSLSFGSALVGSTTAAQTVTITNPNPAAAGVPVITVTGQFTQTNNCPVQLGAGASCTVNVSFAPSSTGTQNGSLNVAPSSVTLTGTGVSANQNLALGKTTSASSANAGFPVSNVNDDNTGSYWESNNNAFPQWAQVDLGSAQQVGSVTLKLPPPSNWATRTQTLSVQGSTDGSNWTTLSASAGRVFDPATGNTVTISLPTSTTRYVRVNITANTGWPAAQLSEFQIFAGGGTGPGSATLTASPTSLSFGNRNIGTTSPAVTVTITNTGSAPASISAISASAQFGQTNTCGSSLPAGGTCFASVTFAPTSTGAKTGNLTIASNATNPTLNVALSGTGTNPAPATLVSSPPSITFPDQAIGGSVLRQAYVSNTGDIAATISSITIAGAGFSLGTNTCGSSLAGSQTCVVNVTFAPTSTGAKTGTITVASNATNPTHTIALSGNGVPAASATLSANPTSLNLGSVAVGSTSGAQGVVITNTGTATAVISGVTASAQFGQSGCVGSLAAGASCTISVTFSPTAVGAQSGTLTVSSNATNPSLAVALSGTGTTTGVTNLALNKPVTAASVAGYGAANAVDGNASTYWESPNSSFPQPFTVDLTSVSTLSSLVLKLPPGWGSRNQTLEVFGSATGSGYTSIVGSASYAFNQGSANTVTINLPANTTARFVRLNFTLNTGWPAGQLSELQVMGIAGTPSNPDLALNKPATVSSTTQNFVGPNAVDTDANTYWESVAGFPQTITVDTGSAQSISRIKLSLPPGWGARSQTLSVLGSTNGSSFTTIVASASYNFDPATGNTVTITFTATSARHVRLNFTANTGATGAQLSGYSIFSS